MRLSSRFIQLDFLQFAGVERHRSHRFPVPGCPGPAPRIPAFGCLIYPLAVLQLLQVFAGMACIRRNEADATMQVMFVLCPLKGQLPTNILIVPLQPLRIMPQHRRIPMHNLHPLRRRCFIISQPEAEVGQAYQLINVLAVVL